MAGLYSNENFPRQTVDALRNLGHDVLTSHEAGRANRQVPDEEVLANARRLERVVLTLNRSDFRKLHRESSGHEGIIVCHVDTDHDRLAKRIHDALKEHNPVKGKLIRISRDSMIAE